MLNLNPPEKDQKEKINQRIHKIVLLGTIGWATSVCFLAALILLAVCISEHLLV